MWIHYAISYHGHFNVFTAPYYYEGRLLTDIGYILGSLAVSTGDAPYYHIIGLVLNDAFSSNVEFGHIGEKVQQGVKVIGEHTGSNRNLNLWYHLVAKPPNQRAPIITVYMW
ncbi:hypothetical protein M5K25_022074 [Dendrobium thyrsiflorum]|uniref:Uncharacterized protein n=1 Tax=Dendrobium thyrsiflorum TaxID=117978 RepID=A0ABD0U5H2_DENTH